MPNDKLNPRTGTNYAEDAQKLLKHLHDQISEQKLDPQIMAVITAERNSNKIHINTTPISNKELLGLINGAEFIVTQKLLELGYHHVH